MARRIIFLLLLSLAPITYANAEDISDVWRDIFTRCRVAIETGKDFDAKGLRNLGRSVRDVPPVAVPGMSKPIRSGYQIAEQQWGVSGGRFIVVEAEYPPEDGKVRRTCDMRLASAAKPISVEEEAHLTSAFLAERRKLLSTGRNELQDSDPIFTTNLGVRLIGDNPNGCRVISGLQIDMRPGSASFLNTGSGEQDGACGGAPRLSHP